MINIKNIEDIASYLKSIGEVLKPIPAKKIQELELEFRHLLPDVYKRFLLLMGNGAGKERPKIQLTPKGKLRTKQ